MDYYTRTTFEMQTSALGAQSAVAGGGRYDGLVEALGGPATPAIGFAVGFDRLAEIVARTPAGSAVPSVPDLFIAALGTPAQQKAFMLALGPGGQRGIRSEMDFADRSLKSQMKRADRLGAQAGAHPGRRAELKKGLAVAASTWPPRSRRTSPWTCIVETLIGRCEGHKSPGRQHK